MLLVVVVTEIVEAAVVVVVELYTTLYYIYTWVQSLFSPCLIVDKWTTLVIIIIKIILQYSKPSLPTPAVQFQPVF